MEIKLSLKLFISFRRNKPELYSLNLLPETAGDEKFNFMPALYFLYNFAESTGPSLLTIFFIAAYIKPCIYGQV